ncbi:MAG: mandelate racemase/muconate lactonizing enzyme family protein [Gemmataceae bacterium]|nr:mandelate racemase/muconate lactonizing enzyme family protein [Gemmataceae bacterium]
MKRANLSRRNILKGGLAGLAGLGLAGSGAAAPAAAGRGLRVVRIERTTVQLQYRPVPGRNMARELPHWVWADVFEVHLQSGHVGCGDNLLYYTWRASSDADLKRVHGRNAAELMWDDTLGAGLQIALFDAVARALEVPVHRLLGRQVHTRTPLAWWNIDTSAEDMAAECREAFRQGYRSYKTKGRPWFDVWEQVRATAKAVPREFKLALDFNDTLRDAERGIPILKALAAVPQVGIYETPIPQSDIRGNVAIRKATPVPVAMHYGSPRPLTALKEDVCDGFVVGGGASALMRTGAVAAMADKPFWLQLVGTGLTAAFSLHFGAVLDRATWPAVNCHQLYTHTLLSEPIRVQDGFAAVPDRPGLGYELDRDALARFRTKRPPERPDPPRLIETRWPDGRHMYFTSTDVNFMLNAANRGRMPYFERGVTTRLLPDDSSPRWRQLYERARKEPVLEKR